MGFILIQHKTGCCYPRGLLVPGLMICFKAHELGTWEGKWRAFHLFILFDVQSTQYPR